MSEQLQKSMREVLKDHGWIHYSTCPTCQKDIKEFWSHTAHPNYEVRIKLKKNTGVILQNNLIIAGPFHGYLMESQLAKLNL